MVKDEVVEAVWLPHANPHLIGHKEAEAALLGAWYSGKMPHAWLISGPRGIGKATLAYRFAKFMLAGGKASDSLFGGKAENLALASDHPTSRRVVAGSHGDLLVLEMKEGKEISVEDARKVAGFLRLTPAESKWRVVIIDSVDHMNRNAANAILKILEEPPANALILLVSHMPGKILPTIRSRCRQLRVNPLSFQGFSDVIQRVGESMANDEATKLYKISHGAPGVALELYEKGGLEYYAKVIDILRGLPRLDTVAVHALGDEVSARGETEAWQILNYMLGYLFHQLSLKAAGQTGQSIVAGEQEVIQAMLAKSPLETWLELWEKIRQSMDDVTRINLDRKHVVINVFSAMAAVFRN